MKKIVAGLLVVVSLVGCLNNLFGPQVSPVKPATATSNGALYSDDTASMDYITATARCQVFIDSGAVLGVHVVNKCTDTSYLCDEYLYDWIHVGKKPGTSEWTFRTRFGDTLYYFYQNAYRDTIFSNCFNNHLDTIINHASPCYTWELE